MRDGRARICVATDVAARGIDLPDLELVIHAELPSNSETLLHRSGRTGRAGRKGVSALIVPMKLRKKAERLLGTAKLSADWIVPPSAEDILAADEARLLDDPVWNAEVSEDAKVFAAKLLQRHAPETIAAAYLALYRSRRSAPEELQAPDAKPQKRSTESFGPSKWFSLSAGRNERAEARWLLPLLCRAGDISKDAIGAIRIQDTETFVEISETAVPGFLRAIGPDMSPEEGLKMTALDAAPDLSRGPRPERGQRPDRGPRPERGPKPEHEQRPDRGPKPEHAPRPAPEAAAPVAAAPAATPASSDDRPPRKPRADKPAGDTPWKKHGGATDTGGDKLWKKKDAKLFDRSRDGAVSERGGKPAGKPGSKPFAKPGSKPGGKPGAKPFAKPGKPEGASKTRGAADTSRRFTPPSAPGAKPGPRPGKPARKGGTEAPKRRD
jgi:ATP-dependent RNA helicase DeaD